ncbi:hypothetical protein [Marinicella meishanensis]|uniref:hypothetical protein n=1 Tax=Marinicella meishanensis TaxID=2873263 RepID=UPI001CBBD2B4|nr:hypothetical protein [Marinicella sp. NBU2979]
MKRIILLWALSLAIPAIGTETNTFDDLPQDFKAYQAWMLKLDLHLLKQDDVVVQLAAIESQAAKVGYQNPPSPPFMQALDAILDKKNTLTKQELHKLYQTCWFNNLKASCDRHDLIQPLATADPQNFFSHMPNFSQALLANDEQQLTAAVEAMANSQFAKKYYGNGIATIKPLVDDFIRNNPIESRDEAALAEQIDALIREHKYPSQLESLFEQNAHHNQVNATAWNYLFSNYNLPALRPLFDTCASVLYEESCLAFADTMIGASDTIDMQQIGYGIKLKILANNNDPTLTETVFTKAKNERSMRCVFSSVSTVSTMFFPIYFDQFFHHLEANGEAQAFAVATQALTKQLLELEVINESKLDRCHDISRMNNDDYLLHYGDDDHIIQKWLIKKDF